MRWFLLKSVVKVINGENSTSTYEDPIYISEDGLLLRRTFNDPTDLHRGKTKYCELYYNGNEVRRSRWMDSVRECRSDFQGFVKMKKGMEDFVKTSLLEISFGLLPEEGDV